MTLPDRPKKAMLPGRMPHSKCRASPVLQRRPCPKATQCRPTKQRRRSPQSIRTPTIRCSPSPRVPVCASSPSRPRPGGGLFVSGEADAQAAIRLYLNDTLVARAEADEAGDISFAIRRGVRAGRYQVRLDDVDPETGTVLSRAEVGFTVPEAVAALPEPQPAPAAQAQAPADDAAQGAEAEATGAEEAGMQDTAGREPLRESQADAAPAASAPGTTAEAESPPEAPATVAERPEATVVVPELSTASVERGDSLWRISRQVYGRGIRYTEIFEANQDQIRNPDLIYPGQVFVLPLDEEAAQDAPEAQAPAAQ